MNGEPNGLGQRIRRCRRTLGENQEVFGARFGVKRLTVINWESGTQPNGSHLPTLTQLLKEEEAKQTHTESRTYQLQLPFDQPINLELRVFPQRADTIHVEVQLLKREAS
jgi:transcriptional regulator with XRE-family HTH domain